MLAKSAVSGKASSSNGNRSRGKRHFAGKVKRMKVNIEVDCTPEEARRLFGLPDLAPLHALYLARVEKLMDKGITPDMVETMVKNWVPMGEAGMGLVQSLLGQFGGSMLGGGKKAASDDVKPSGSGKR